MIDEVTELIEAFTQLSHSAELAFTCIEAALLIVSALLEEKIYRLTIAGFSFTSFSLINNVKPQCRSPPNNRVYLLTIKTTPPCRYYH